MRPDIVVLGAHSYGGNVVRVHHVPVIGETVTAWDFHFHKDGGKGSHQAIVINRLGGHSAFIGKIGCDERSEIARGWLVEEGIDLRHLLCSEKIHPTVGLKMIDDNGDNAIVSVKSEVPEDRLEFEEVRHSIEDYKGAKIFITGFEIPLKTALDGARLAKQLGMLTIVNPAPALQEPLGLLDYIDILIPNELEAKSLVGIDLQAEFNPGELLVSIKEKYKVGIVIITAGEEGAYGFDGKKLLRVSPMPVVAVDTTGAGDAFIGGLALSLSRRQEIVKAMEFGNAVAALSVTCKGTIQAFPLLAEVEEFIRPQHRKEPRGDPAHLPPHSRGGSGPKATPQYNEAGHMEFGRMDVNQARSEARAWVEVNLGNLAYNIRSLKEKIGPGVKLLPLLKANAYGCGIGVVGKIAAENGADWLGVELVEEALVMRQAKISAPILAVGPVAAWQAEVIVKNDLRITVRDVETLNAISACAGAVRKVMPIHIELDTGLRRLGFQAEEALIFVQQIEKTPNVKLEGVWTHFASSDDQDPSFTRHQFEKYQAFIRALNERGIEVPIRHAANSAALIQYPEMRLNMSRCGETVYGLVPRRDLAQSLGLKPVVEWKTRLVWIQSVAKGVSVGYGRSWVAERDSRIGTISLGYADGYRRSFANRAHALVRGMVAPVIGKLSMQTTMVDLTDIPESRLNDEVVVMGQQGGRCVTAYDLAEIAGTGEFEILVDISDRVPRVYLPSDPR